MNYVEKLLAVEKELYQAQPDKFKERVVFASDEDAKNFYSRVRNSHGESYTFDEKMKLSCVSFVSESPDEIIKDESIEGFDFGFTKFQADNWLEKRNVSEIQKPLIRIKSIPFMKVPIPKKDIRNKKFPICIIGNNGIEPVPENLRKMMEKTKTSCKNPKIANRQIKDVEKFLGFLSTKPVFPAEIAEKEGIDVRKVTKVLRMASEMNLCKTVTMKNEKYKLRSAFYL